jgi:hypothetical protein
MLRPWLFSLKLLRRSPEAMATSKPCSLSNLSSSLTVCLTRSAFRLPGYATSDPTTLRLLLLSRLSASSTSSCVIVVPPYLSRIAAKLITLILIYRSCPLFSQSSVLSLLLPSLVLIIPLSLSLPSIDRTMAHDAARSIIGPFLTTRSYLTIRIVTPICNYFVLSFFFCMIDLPFKVPFGQGPFSYAGGFFLWWIFLWAGMCSLGLATEAAITVLTPKFISFFLIALIVVSYAALNIPLLVCQAWRPVRAKAEC